MNSIHRSLVLLREGQEIHAPRELLDISPQDACRHVPGAPYSLAHNVAHAANWQRLWLHELGFEHALPEDVDEWNWPAVDPSQWPGLCHRFLEGLDEAIRIASGPINDKTEFVLNQILIHDAYHIGECILLTRLLE